MSYYNTNVFYIIMRRSDDDHLYRRVIISTLDRVGQIILFKYLSPYLLITAQNRIVITSIIDNKFLFENKTSFRDR